MLRFFTKIRYKLAFENKPMKYLRYAIGEILLVVIGILIALQVNNWNHQIKDSILEQKYLKEINSDFIENKAQLERNFKELNIVFESSRTLRKQLPITNENWSSMYKEFEFVFRPGWTFNPKIVSIEGLIVSGNIHVIKNDELKKLILSFNDQFEDYQEEEIRAENMVKKWEDIYLEESALYKDNIETIFPTDELKIKLEKLLIMRRDALALLLSKWEISQESEEMMQTIDSIISLTDQELMK
jgi:hypothetical protein